MAVEPVIWQNGCPLCNVGIMQLNKIDQMTLIKFES